MKRCLRIMLLVSNPAAIATPKGSEFGKVQRARPEVPKLALLVHDIPSRSSPIHAADVI